MGITDSIGLKSKPIKRRVFRRIVKRLLHGGITVNLCRLVCCGLIARMLPKDFSKAERIDYARRLERIESLKAEKRKAATQFGGGGNISTTVGTTRDIVASKLRYWLRKTV